MPKISIVVDVQGKICKTCEDKKIFMLEVTPSLPEPNPNPNLNFRVRVEVNSWENDKR